MSAIREILSLNLRKVPRAHFTLTRTLATAAVVSLALGAATGTASASAARTQPSFAPQAPGHVLSSAQVSRLHPGVKPGEAAAPNYLCLTNDSSLCLVANGAGNQVTINTNGYMNISIVNSGYCSFTPDGTSYPCAEMEDAAGNCIRAGTNNVVKLGNGACLTGDDTDWWVATGGNYLKSLQYDNTMFTHGNGRNYNVWHATPVSGDWYRWSFHS